MNIKYKYRIVKKSDSPYYLVEAKPTGIYGLFCNWFICAREDSLIEARVICKRAIHKDSEIKPPVTMEIIEVFNP